MKEPLGERQLWIKEEELAKCEECGKPFALVKKRGEAQEAKRICLRCQRSKKELRASGVIFEYTEFWELREWKKKPNKKPSR